MAKKIVVIGGGHGSSVVLSGLKNFDVDLTAIISMADDGGSTGDLRNQLGVSAVGDIRQCLSRLTDSSELGELFSYRFANGDLSGHSLGNLFLAAGQLMTGSIHKSIDIAREALDVKANIIPVTDVDPQLILEQNGQDTVGVIRIAKTAISEKPNLKLAPEAIISPSASSAISNADLIVIAPGHFYCSIVPALLVKGMDEALKSSSAPVVFMGNLTSSELQNKDFSIQDYLSEVNRLVGAEVVDIVLVNKAKIPTDRLKQGESQVFLSNDPNVSKKHTIITEDILDGEEAQSNPNDKIAGLRSKFRHDKQKVAEILTNIMITR